MAEITLEATRGAHQVTVARSLETDRLAGADAQLVIDNAKSKLEINLAMAALWQDLQTLFIGFGGGSPGIGATFDDFATFDDGAIFSDQTVTGIT